MKRRPLTVIILLYIIALVVGRYYSGSLFLYFVFSAMGIAWFIVAFIKKAPALWWFMGFLLLFGFWYGGTRTAEPPPFPIAAEETCTVTGKVITFPEVGEDKQTFLFRADAVNGEKSDLKLYISASVEDDISYCDILEITGTVSANHPVANPGGFAFGDYLRNLHASAVISSRYDGKVETIGHDANVLESCFSFIRNRFETACEPLTRQGAAMVRGIFLGDTSSLDQEYTDVLTKTGIRHCFSVSGLHVGYIVILLMALGYLLPMGKEKQWLILLPFLFLYCGVTGFEPAVLRASVMALVLSASYSLGRQFDPYSSLSLAAFILLLWDPANLWLAGFQMSFVAMLSIFLFQKFFRKLLPKKGPEGLWNAIAVTFAAQVGLLPVVAVYFNVVSVISFILSPILCVAVGGIVIIALVATIIALFAPVAATVFLYGAEALGYLVSGFSELAAALPGAYFASAAMSPLWLIVIEGVLLLALFLPWFRFRPLAALGVMTLVLVFFFVPISPFQRNHDFTVTFLSVGNGDCIHLHTPEGKNYLIDAAGQFNDSTGVYTIRPYLLSQGITTLDGIFCTHGDADHSGSIPYLLSYFPTDTLYLSAAAMNSYKDLPDIAKSEGVAVVPLSRGHTLSLGESITMKILAPAEEDYGPDNELSLVMYVTDRNTSLLFCGDMSGVGLEHLVNRNDDLSADILQLPHHGSATGFSVEFYHAVSPEAVVGSLSPNSKYFPDDNVAGYWRQADIPFYRTDEDGAITFTMEDEGWEVSCYLPYGTAKRTTEHRLFHNN